jgi:signal peptidase II
MSRTLVIAVSLIFSGALGNIIDSVFYGMIFNQSYNEVATLFSSEPYGSLFYGKVVDMLYFPIIDTTWPDWLPYLGGSNFRFFEPVFNIADTAISTGVGILLVFNKKAFKENVEKEKVDLVETTVQDYVPKE